MDKHPSEAAPEDSCSLRPRSTPTIQESPVPLSSSSGINCTPTIALPHQQGLSHPLYLVLPQRPSVTGWPANQHIHPPAAERPNANMSAVAALQFDPVFSRGGRSSFNSWLGLDNPEASSSYIASNLTSMGPTSDTSLSPPLTSSSITSSPSRGGLTAQQRELKRQRDQVRRDSKASARVQRGSINPYLGSPPLSVADVAAMGVYSTAPAPVSLLAEPVTTMATSSYMHSYSPPVPEPTYADGFHQTMPAAYSMGVDYTAQFSAPSPYERSPPLALADPPMMYGVNPSVSSSASPPSEHSHVRVVQSRPKPQCWEHGCNGRQFSTFSNLLRHQREKSGQAAKATCPNCGAEFTRTTARNGHLLLDKCKQRRNS